MTPTLGESVTNFVPLSPSVFSDYAGQARLRHPALRAAQERRIAAEAARAGVRSFADPTVKANVMVSSSRGPRDSEDGNLGYGVEERLPLLGKERAARNLATAEAAVLPWRRRFNSRRFGGMSSRPSSNWLGVNRIWH